MLYRIFLFLWSFLLDIVVISRLTDEEKDLEILLLRQQLRIVERVAWKNSIHIAAKRSDSLASIFADVWVRGKNGISWFGYAVAEFRFSRYDFCQSMLISLSEILVVPEGRFSAAGRCIQ